MSRTATFPWTLPIGTLSYSHWLERWATAAAASRRSIEAMKEDVTLVSDGANLLLGLYDLERMADHATNIAENVIFLAEAKLVRHRAVNEEGIDLMKSMQERDSD